MKIGGEKKRNVSGLQGENERQGKKKRTRTQATKLLVSTYDISYIHVRCVIRNFHVIVVRNNVKEMYKKVCCTCQVVFLFAN